MLIFLVGYMGCGKSTIGRAWARRLGKPLLDFQMSAEKLAARLEHGRAKRPLLRDKSEDELVEYIRENIRRREPFYSQARLVIGCDGVSDDYVVSHVVLYLEHCEADEAARRDR